MRYTEYTSLSIPWANLLKSSCWRSVKNSHWSSSDLSLETVLCIKYCKRYKDFSPYLPSLANILKVRSSHSINFRLWPMHIILNLLLCNYPIFPPLCSIKFSPLGSCNFPQGHSGENNCAYTNTHCMCSRDYLHKISESKVQIYWNVWDGFTAYLGWLANSYKTVYQERICNATFHPEWF